MPEAIEAFSSAKDSADLLLRISALTNKKLEKNKTLIFLDEVNGRTVVQRTKNSFIDYRFVVEPDIKPFSVSEEFIEKARVQVGELPEAKRVRFKSQFGLSDFDVETLTSSRDLSLWFEDAASQSKDVKKVANWILAEVLAILNEKNIPITEFHLTPKHIAKLADSVSDDKITSKQAKDVFAKMLETSKYPEEIIAELGLTQVTDNDAILTFVKEVVQENPKAVEDFKNGKTNVVGWLMGQVMKKSGGKANPKTATELLKQILSEV